MNDKSHLLRFGYAPGNYWFVCRDCGNKHAVGDKRSTRCEACAESLYAQITSVEDVVDKHRAMTTLPEEAVKAAQNAIRTTNWEYGITDADMAKALTAALPFLPVQGAVKKLEWWVAESGDVIADSIVGRYRLGKVTANINFRLETPSGLIPKPAPDYYWPEDEAKAAAQADYEARVLSALEPSAARELALEEGYRQGIEAAAKLIECGCKSLLHGKGECQFPGNCSLEDAAAIRALSSPDHADAGKVEGDGWMPTHRHKKRGTDYSLIGIGKMQADNWQVSREGFDQSIDMEEVAIYRSVDDGSLWVRPHEEFEDGRFETIPTPPSGEVA